MRQWQYAGSPCAPSVVWHITPDAAHRGKMPRIAIRREPFLCTNHAPGDGFVAIAARRKPPCAPSVVWHITPDAAHRGKMSRIVIHRGVLSAPTAPRGTASWQWQLAGSPLRAVGRLAYRAGRCASQEAVEDSDSPGIPLRKRAPGDGFDAMAVRWKPPCASSVAWHIAPDGGLAAKAAATGAFCRKGGVRRMLSGR